MSTFVSVITEHLERLLDKQVYRYMGVSEIPSRGEVRTLVEQLKPRFLEQVDCKACYVVVPIHLTDKLVDFSFLSVTSRHLAKNLRGCEYAVLFAATLGMPSEQQRRRAAAVSPAEALVLDAMGSAAIEQFCDQICCKLAQEYPTYHLRPRFSPGYGDFSLDTQERILQILDAQRKIGITLSGGNLMIPQKSVTAVVGLSKNGCINAVPDCECCSDTACEFRL